MAPVGATTTPGLALCLKTIANEPVDKSIEYFISLLKRRQIQGSKSSAIATAYLLRRVISTTRGSEHGKLVQKVNEVGRRLIASAPTELAIGNIVRRVLGLIRDEEEENRADSMSTSLSDLGSETVTTRGEAPMLFSSLASTLSTTAVAQRRDQDGTSKPPLLSAQTGMLPSTRALTSMFSISSHPTMRSGTSSPGLRSGSSTPGAAGGLLSGAMDVRAEILEGIAEIIDELDQSDEQIANYALEHIYPTETIITYSSSQTVQRFLLKAASKRKFTVIHVEGHPNSYSKSHSLVTGNPPVDSSDSSADLPHESFQKPLVAAGVTVLLVPDSAIFAMMSRANKVLISAHAVLANGSAILPAGSQTMVRAAKFHHVPVLVLAATFKLSPLYPHDPESFIEYANVAKVIPYQDGELRRGLAAVRNPVWDFVNPDDVDLYVTNVGSVATGYLYTVVRDQYRDEDLEL